MIFNYNGIKMQRHKVNNNLQLLSRLQHICLALYNDNRQLKADQWKLNHAITEKYYHKYINIVHQKSKQNVSMDCQK